MFWDLDVLSLDVLGLDILVLDVLGYHPIIQATVHFYLSI